MASSDPARTFPSLTSSYFIMHRLWIISLSLCCCLLMAAVWTSSKSGLPPLADPDESIATANYIKAIKESWTNQTTNTSRDSDETSRSVSLTGNSVQISSPPERAFIPTLALPLQTKFKPGEAVDGLPSSQTLSELQQKASARELPIRTATVIGRPPFESRVSAERPLTADEDRPTDRTTADSQGVWELTAQELQVSNTHLSYGKTLARKGATASARSEFLNALAVIAQSRDLRLGGKDHVTALNQALLAIAEAEDFFARPGGSHLDADVATVAAGHLSRILESPEANQLTRSEALSAYYDFARRNLELACGRTLLASETFYALGRLHNLLGLADPAQQTCELNKAVIFHQAALAANANNFASANELGVLLARQGQFEEAKSLFIQSVTLNPRRETWTNLSNTHQRLGESKLAQLAAAEAKSLMEQNTNLNTSPLIRLVAPSEFEALPSDQDYGPAERSSQKPNDSPNPPLK